jgi:serine/threonine protein kinase/formylglycine-generating enzyme required for sulfatase activity
MTQIPSATCFSHWQKFGRPLTSSDTGWRAVEDIHQPIGRILALANSAIPFFKVPMKNKSQDSASSPRSDFAAGQKLAGCYGLVRRIDAGSGPEIWLAVDDVLGKEVSLHFVPAGVAGDAESMNGLRQEVKRTRQLIHPNILRVYDLVEEGDWAAVSMDAFAGESLAAKLSQTNGAGLSPADLQPWLGQLFRTLDDAHKINVTHRDLSPADLVLGADGKLLVKNFGVSRFMADAMARISGTTDGRLAARSPQQIAGAASSQSDDIYAVGTLLFEALAGRLPFSGKDLAGQIQNAVAPAIDQAAHQIPDSWRKTIAACLEKNPTARPQTVAEIAKTLAEPVPSDAAPAPEPEPVAAVRAKTEEVAAATSGETAMGSGSSHISKQSDGPVTLVEMKTESATSANSSAKRTGFPTLGLAVAAGLIVIGLAGYFSQGGKKQMPPEAAVVVHAPAEPVEDSDIRPASNKLEGTPLLAEPALTETKSEAEPAAVPTVYAASDAGPISDTPQLLASASPVVAVVAPVVAAPARRPAPIAVAPTGDEDKVVAEKAAALEAAKQAALEAEKAHADMLKKQQLAAAAAAEAEKALAEKSKAIAPVKKATAEVLALRKKLEDEQKAADLAAQQARQLAEEKVRSAEAAKKAIAELEAKNKEKFAAQEKVEAEIMTLQKSLADRQELGASVAKDAAAVATARAKQVAAMKQSEQELNQAKLAADEARRLREVAEMERRKLAQELADMQKMMDRKRAEIEERLKKLEKAETKPPVAIPVAEPVKAPEPKPVTPPPAPKPVSVATPPPATPVPAPPAPVAVVPNPVAPTPAPEPVPAAPAPPAPTELALKTDPEKSVPTPTPKNAGAENSLGMKFVPVGDVEFSVWQTRVRDFEIFAKAVNLRSPSWKSPGFKQGPDHPVVNVTWLEAVAFCKWLTEEERKTGALTANQFYRLPTDVEWSKAVGLPEESGKTPEARDMGISDVYPWGNQWPPPPKSGNYTGEETGSDVAIKGYDDGFPWTSPVGSFTANKLGLYDMGGNVWQWCMDTWNNDSKAKVLRGASWYNGALKLSLLSSCRVRASPESSTDNYGFRVVRAAIRK